MLAASEQSCRRLPWPLAHRPTAPLPTRHWASRCPPPRANLLLTLLGVCTAMQVQAAELLAACTPFSYGAAVLASACLLVSLVLQRTLRGIALISAAGLAVLILGLLAVAAYGIAVYGDDLTSLPESFSAFPSDVHALALFFGICCFSFGLQMTLLPVQDSLREPSRASAAVHYSLILIVLLYALVGYGLGALFARAPPRGVEQLILLNLPQPSPLATAVQCSSAAVALLSYPLPLMPLVQLMRARLASCGRLRFCCRKLQQKPLAGDSLLPAEAGAVVRLGTLVLTSLLALVLRQFGIAAGFVGSLSIFASLVLPPLCHLRLCAWPPGGMAPRRSGAAALDVALVSLGMVAFMVFTYKAFMTGMSRSD